MKGLRRCAVIACAAGFLVPGVLSAVSSAGEFVTIPAGRFVMGSSADAYEHEVASGETPPFTVSIRTPFEMGTREVTIGEFRRFVLASGRHIDAGCRVLTAGTWQWSPAASWERPRSEAASDDEPVTCVSFADAQAFADWRSAAEGRSFRLPSESEWEYAARAGTITPRPWGTVRESHEGVSISLACDYANVYDIAAARSMTLPWPNARCSDGYLQAAPVGRFAPNAFGLFDMIGNAREWVADCHTTSYKGRPADERAWLWQGGCERRVVRGGSWATRPFASRSAFREGELATLRQSDLGFRLVRGPAAAGASPARKPSRPID